MAESRATSRNSVLPPGSIHLLRLQAEKTDDLILIPQPSTHPDDPLNWVRWRKFLNLFLVLFYTFTTGVAATVVYSVFTPISENTGITIAQLNQGTGYLFLLGGWSNLLWQPLALTFGRRPVFLASLIGCIAITEWTAWISSYGSWAAARCLYGFFVAPVEVLPEICIPDVFFAHERGTYLGLYMFTLAGSNFFAPMVAGFMNDALGWRSVQHFGAILLGVNLVLAFFLQEESMFLRGTAEVDLYDQPLSETQAKTATNGVETKDLDNEKLSVRPIAHPGATATTLKDHKKTYTQKLALWSYSGVTRLQFLRLMYRPILIFFTFPNIAWAGFMYGSALAWFNVYNATASAIFSAPPYSFSAAIVGLTYVAPIIGVMIAGLATGRLSDWYVLKLARRNNGLREPEQRLWGLLVYCPFILIGLLLWGVGAAHGLPWPVLCLGAAFCGYANVAGGAYALAYAVDCFKEISGESIVSVILCRNTMSFAFNYAITPWIDDQGLQNTFIAVAILAFAFGASFLLMEWKGKSLRARCAQRYWRYVDSRIVELVH